MANAFTLFGELKADTRSFENSLYKAEVRLNQTGRAIADTERKAEKLGQTSALSARKYEKLNDAVGTARDRMRAATAAFDRGDISAKRLNTVIEQTNNKVSSLNSRLRDAQARLRDLPSAFSRFRDDLVSVGKWGGLAAGAIAAFAIKSAMSIEEARNKFTALEGSVDKANQRIQKLLDLSRKSVGVDFGEALASFSQLQVLGTVGEQSIEKMIQALGKLRLAFNSSMGSSSDFLLNLQQLFSQGFEMQDWKQAIGRVPIFEQLIEQAFGTKDPAKLKELKAAGKLTMDTWVAGIAEAANTDKRLEGLSETFGTKINKALTEINIVAAPLGQKMIDAIRPALDDLTKELQKAEPDLNVWSQRTGESMGRGLGEALIDGVKKLKESVAEEFSKEEGKQGILPFADGLSEGMIKALTDKGLFPETPIFKEGFISGLKRIYGPGIEMARDIGKKVGVAMRDSGVPAIKEFGSRAVAVIVGLGPTLLNAAVSLGKNVITGMVNGLRSGYSQVTNTIKEMANAAVAAANSALMIRSPSKVFFAIGQDVARGFIDGLESLKTGVQASMARLLDVSGIKGLTKTDAPGIELLTDLINQLDELTPRTKLEAAMAQLTADKYKNLNKEIRDRIILAAKQLDLEERRGKLLEKYTALAGEGATFQFPDFSMFEAEGSGAGLFDELEQQIKQFETEWDGLIQSMGTPPPIDTWGNFWGGMQYHLQKFKESLPSIKEALGVNLINSISQVGDVFANAVAYWDGTAKGFFQSLAQGFRQMVQQIISELIRLMVMKAIMQIVGSFAGGIGGGSGIHGAADASAPLHGGFAEGGLARGAGTSTSDSILARLSSGEFVMSAKAVKKWGVGFMEQLNSGFTMPTPAFAGGGAVTTNNYSSSWAPHVTVNVSGGGSPDRVRQSAKQGVHEAMRMMEREKMRQK